MIEAVFDLVGVLVGLVLLAVGLLLIYGIWFIKRRSVRALPDDAVVARLWAEHGARPLPNANRTLRAAAARIEEGSVDIGHEALGLPAPSGVRLAAELGRGRPWFVADVWNVNSVARQGSQTTSAAVQIRAVAAMELDRPAPSVIVGPENAFTLLVDAAGLGDVKLEGESFNRAFRVRAGSSADAYAVLTPEVMHAMELGGGRFAMEVNGRLLTVTEVSGRRGRPASGQRESLASLGRIMEQLARGIRPHTWPEATSTSPDEWRGDNIVVDPRPPGAPHASPRSTGKVSDVVVTTVAAVMATAGLVVATLNVLDLVRWG